MRKGCFLVIFYAVVQLGYSQALFNNQGAAVYVKDGGFMVVKSANGLYNNLGTGAGKIDNQGTIVVEGPVKNDALITGSSDTIRLTGDWINNNQYAGNNSWVDMYGGNQLITGNAVTTFSSLNLGGGAVVKQQTLNAKASGFLALNDAELATDVFEMAVTNGSPSAVTRQNGFVSSVGQGRLTRSTNSASAYLFPTGSPSYVNGPSLFRPVSFTPATAAANTFSACLVKGDATTDGYDVTALDNQLCSVNPLFYHRLYHATGADVASLAMYYDQTTDGNWTDEGHWKTSQWNYLGNAVAGNGLNLSSVTVSGVNNFIPEPFALANRKVTVDAGHNVSIYEGQSTTLHASLSATGYNVEWSPDDALACADCPSTVATPTSTTLYTVKVAGGAGCNASDTVLVTVVNNELLLPTGFSPNADGTNDRFHILNKNVQKMDLQVFNRWGEKIFETTDITIGWDGTYKNNPQAEGVYTWQCNYTLIGDTKIRYAKGNLTLIR